jgi:hypothetical protein
MIDLGPEGWRDLLMILGAARPLFKDFRDQETTPGILKELLDGYIDRSEELSKTIVEQLNA